MANISLLSRLVNGVQRQVDLSANTLVVQAIQINGTLLSSSGATAGSTLVGDNNTYSHFTPTAATVKGALSGIDTALGSISGFATTALSNLASVAVNVDLTPGADNSINLGSASKRWAAGFIGLLKDASGVVQADLTNRVLKDSSAANSVDWQGRFLVDSAAATQLAWSTSGVTISANPLDLNSHKIVNLSAGSTSTDAVNYGQAILASGANAFAADQSMGSHKLTNLANGTASGDAVNFGQLSSLSTGLVWQNPVRDPDITDDSLTAPPGSPIYSLTYIIGASATGAWAGFDGHVVWWDGSNWIDVSNGLALGTGTQTAVQVGDRFGVSIDTPEHFTFTVTAANATAGAIYTDSNGYQFIVQSTIVAGTTLLANSSGYPPASGTLTKLSGSGDATITYSSFTAQLGGSFAGHHNAIATVTNATPGSYAYTFASPVNNWAFNVNGPGSQHFGSSYTYVTTSLSWVDFSGPSKTLAGNALAYSGNTLNVLFDGITIDLTSNQLEVKAGGISNTQISASAAIAYSKLNLSNSIVNADISASAGIVYGKLNLSNSIVAGDLTANSVTSSKVNTNVFDQVTITGGGGSAAAVAQAPVVAWTETAGQSFSANTTYAVRYGLPLNAETAGRVYAADIDTSSFDLFWVIGFIQTTGSITAGQSVTVISSGSLTLKSGDTNFGSNDPGKPLFLQSGGINASTTAPSTTGQAVAKVGIVQSTTSFRIQVGAVYVA